jgi:phosphate starvation-inducible protein PhoH
MMAFMQGRKILDGLVILHESVHEMRLKRLREVILKIDFQKT